VKAVIRSTEEDYADRISKALATLDEEKKAWALKSVYEPIPKTSLMHAHRKIGKDLDRTFPALGKAFSPELVSSMSRILLTFAHMHGEIGYVQGFNYICGTLLLAIHDNTADSKRQQKQIMASYEATAFAMFNTIVIQVQDCFLPGMAGLYEIRARVTNGLERYLPELGAHIKAIDVDPVLFLQPWVVSLFTYATFCREFSYRIIGFLLTWTYCDCHAEAVKPTLTGDETLDASRRMYEGIARVSLAILHNHKTTLLAATQDNFCAYLREITTEETAESAEEVVRKAVTLGQWKDIIND
jgi:hypothetical protein